MRKTTVTLMQPNLGVGNLVSRARPSQGTQLHFDKAPSKTDVPIKKLEHQHEHESVTASRQEGFEDNIAVQVHLFEKVRWEKKRRERNRKADLVQRDPVYVERCEDEAQLVTPEQERLSRRKRNVSVTSKKES